MIRLGVLLLMCALPCGCEDPASTTEVGPCETANDCPVSDVCVAKACVDAWSGVEFQLSAVSVDECEGEYMFAAGFAGEPVGIADQWRTCPGTWPASADAVAFVPTDAAETFTLTLTPRYAGVADVVVAWAGIPKDVLHYGQWHGREADHAISIWFDRVE